MKIQCDVCHKDEAAIFCPADEAVLCNACDHSVHHANKLAGKHHRFPLLQPTPKEIPLCDICQEKRAFLFCQQDRAILCKDCDISIHKSNEHTKNHNRFLLTGIKIPAICTIYSVPSSISYVTADNNCDTVVSFDNPEKSITKPNLVPSLVSAPTSIAKAKSLINSDKGSKSTNPKVIMSGVGNGSTSSISDYLTEMLPGWHVEDFLDSSSDPDPQGFCKTGENHSLPSWDDNLDRNLKFYSSENIGMWVPQAPTPQYQPQCGPSFNMALGGQICFKDPKESTTNINYRKNWRHDGGFSVPEISPPISKRSRTLW